MSNDRSLRSRIRARKASRQLRNSHRSRFNRALRIENLEVRSLMAGLVDEFGAMSGEGEGATAGDHDHDHDHHHFNVPYLPPRVNVWRESQFNLSNPSATPATDPATTVLNFIKANAGQFGISPTDVQQFALTNQYKDATGTTFLYGQQMAKGIRVANALFNASVAKNGEILNVSVNFVPGLQTANLTQTPAVSAIDAYKVAIDGVDGQLIREPTVLTPVVGLSQRQEISSGGVAQGATIKAELYYLPVSQSQTKLTWKLNLPMIDGAWYEAFVSAEPNEANRAVESANNWVSDFAYRVFDRPSETPADTAATLVVNPHDPLASPFSWHDVNGIPGPDFQDTRGNNVFAQEDRDGVETAFPLFFPPSSAGQRPNGGPTHTFDFPVDLTRDPQLYTNASTTNLFYWTNLAHDILFHYGFNEQSGNFQMQNYTQLGLGQDPVYAFSQAGAAAAVPTLNNAFMATPPDGTSPIIAMFEWNISNPRRDGSLDGFIISHEYMHGVSGRLTGGPNNAGALGAQQSQGMNEGWSDFFGLWMTQSAPDTNITPRPGGNYVLNQPPTGTGIRRFPYSFDQTVNPLTLSVYNGGIAPCVGNSPCESHNAGEIWASALWDMNWLLIDKYGFDPDVYRGVGGNNVAMDLVIMGEKLQPANPSFLEGRDAILAADTLLYKGVNHQQIWEAFSRRGFGLNASTLNSTSTVVAEAFNLPSAASTVSGKVFADANGNGVQDGNEQGIANVTMFVDLDGDGQLDPLEPTTLTAADGTYAFQFFVPGAYAIGQVVPPGFQQTTPAGGNGTTIVTVVNNQNVGNINFGDRPGNPVSGGTVFLDEDANGQRHPFEPGMANVAVYADIDSDGRLDAGEPSAVTAADGTYRLTLNTPGTYFVRQAIPPGFVQTFPANQAGHQVTVVSGILNVTFDFGNAVAQDWGDAPASFPTLAANGGVSHGVLPGFFLGGGVDVEANGSPSADATGDDVSGIDDEDGVAFTSILFPGSTTNVQVTVNLKDRFIETVQGRSRVVVRNENAAGRLHAWVDFNRDGDWNDADEKVFSDQLLLEGVHNLTFPVPATATPGVTHARFRYAYDNVLGPGGPASAGEVEDYQVRILAETPDAIDDVFQVDQNTNANILPVLDNDVASAAGPLTIISVGATTNGGTVLISPDGLSLRYSPRQGFIGNDAFNYTVRDPAGRTDTARVSVTVLPAFAQPIAIDDSFDVFGNSTNNELNVMANDLVGRFPPIGIVSFSAPANGFVQVDNRGTPTTTDDVLRYTPNAGFSGTDIFQYTIEDSINQQSTASVTVHVQPGDSADDIVQYRLLVTDINNNPITALGVGEAFKLRVFVDDLRTDDGVPDGVDRRGIGAGYLDVLFPFNLVSLSAPINFAPEYRNATSGDLDTPGLIDEVGALQTGGEPLGANEILLFEISGVATGVGTARFVGDPADLISENPGVPPDHDTVFFEPPTTAPIRQIRYVNSTVQVVGTGARPQVTDNTFVVPLNAVNLPLNVLANDVEVNSPPLTISAVGTPTTTTFPTPNGGVVTISPNGLQLLYTPRNGFVGTEQFSYTAANAAGLTATGIVTVQVGNAVKDLTLRVDTTNLQGQHIDSIALGGTFQVRVFVQDIRANAVDPGVFAAYLDLLYDGGLVSTITDFNTPLGFQIEFGPQYGNGTSASNASPNLVDELGAFQISFDPLGSGEFLLATINFHADNAGVASFFGDPADVTPLHDVLLFEPSNAAVELSQIGYRSASITITGGNGEGEARFQNPNDRYDVNNDGHRSAIDALVVVNRLNAAGGSSNLAAGEGEGSSTMYYDVNGDNKITPIDVLQIVNRLNADTGHGEGESAVDAGPGLLEGNSSIVAMAPTGNSDGQEILDVGPPRMDATTTQMSRPVAPRNVLPATGPERPTVGSVDRVFADLVSRDTRASTGGSDVESLLAEDVFAAWNGTL